MTSTNDDTHDRTPPLTRAAPSYALKSKTVAGEALADDQRPQTEFRPDIEGLRAVAVLAVVFSIAVHRDWVAASSVWTFSSSSRAS